jgi:phosphorylcholine metabolism protein LicD
MYSTLQNTWCAIDNSIENYTPILNQGFATRYKSESNCYKNVMYPEEDKILEELIDTWTKLAEELGITWSVCAGSYIGTLRHQGRIPWDDDFDITIMKKDWKKVDKMSKKILDKYNLTKKTIFKHKSLWLIKIYFNDHRSLNCGTEKEGCWPFIDIFLVDKKEGQDCDYIDKSELPIVKKPFGNTYVNIYQNPSNNRKWAKNLKWKNELYDDGHRHKWNDKIIGNNSYRIGTAKNCKIINI